MNLRVRKRASASGPRFQLVPTTGLKGGSRSDILSTGETGTVLGVVGKSDPLDNGEGLSLWIRSLHVARGKITATVELEGRTLALGDFTSLLDTIYAGRVVRLSILQTRHSVHVQ